MAPPRGPRGGGNSRARGRGRGFRAGRGVRFPRGRGNFSNSRGRQDQSDESPNTSPPRTNSNTGERYDGYQRFKTPSQLSRESPSRSQRFPDSPKSSQEAKGKGKDLTNRNYRFPDPSHPANESSKRIEEDNQNVRSSSPANPAAATEKKGVRLILRPPKPPENDLSKKMAGIFTRSEGLLPAIITEWHKPEVKVDTQIADLSLTKNEEGKGDTKAPDPSMEKNEEVKGGTQDPGPSLVEGEAQESRSPLVNVPSENTQGLEESVIAKPDGKSNKMGKAALKLAIEEAKSQLMVLTSIRDSLLEIQNQPSTSEPEKDTEKPPDFTPTIRRIRASGSKAGIQKYSSSIPTGSRIRLREPKDDNQRSSSPAPTGPRNQINNFPSIDQEPTPPVQNPAEKPAEKPVEQWRRDPAEVDRAFYRGKMSELYQTLKAARVQEREDAIRDRKISDPDKPTTLAEAIKIVGTCQDMCAEFERTERISQMMLEGPETIPALKGKRIASEPRMVKRFRRSAAGYDEQLPSDIRPPQVLQMTLNYLFDEVIGTKNEPLKADIHRFIWDRTRSIRNDFSIQQVTKVEDVKIAMDCYERIARFHILCLHQFSGPTGEGTAGFDHHQELEQLANTLISLSYLYDDNKGKVTSPNEAEFRAYSIIFDIEGPKPDIEERAQSWREPLFKEPLVQTALQLYASAVNNSDEQGPWLRSKVPFIIAQMNPAAFLAMVKSDEVPYTLACFTEIYFHFIRAAALEAIWRGYKVKRGLSNRPMQEWPLSDMTPALGFDEPSQAREFVENHGFKVSSRKNGDLFVDLGTVPHIQKWMRDSNPRRKQVHSKSMVESKRMDRSLHLLINSSCASEAKSRSPDVTKVLGSPESLFITGSSDDEAKEVQTEPKAPKESSVSTPSVAVTASPSPKSDPFVKRDPSKRKEKPVYDEAMVEKPLSIRFDKLADPKTATTDAQPSQPANEFNPPSASVRTPSVASTSASASPFGNTKPSQPGKAFTPTSATFGTPSAASASNFGSPFGNAKPSQPDKAFKPTSPTFGTPSAVASTSPFESAKPPQFAKALSLPSAITPSAASASATTSPFGNAKPQAAKAFNPPSASVGIPSAASTSASISPFGNVKPQHAKPFNTSSATFGSAYSASPSPSGNAKPSQTAKDFNPPFGSVLTAGPFGKAASALNTAPSPSVFNQPSFVANPQPPTNPFAAPASNGSPFFNPPSSFGSAPSAASSFASPSPFGQAASALNTAPNANVLSQPSSMVNPSPTRNPFASATSNASPFSNPQPPNNPFATATSNASPFFNPPAPINPFAAATSNASPLFNIPAPINPFANATSNAIPFSKPPPANFGSAPSVVNPLVPAPVFPNASPFLNLPPPTYSAASNTGPFSNPTAPAQIHPFATAASSASPFSNPTVMSFGSAPSAVNPLASAPVFPPPPTNANATSTASPFSTGSGSTTAFGQSSSTANSFAPASPFTISPGSESANIGAIFPVTNALGQFKPVPFPSTLNFGQPSKLTPGYSSKANDPPNTNFSGYSSFSQSPASALTSTNSAGNRGSTALPRMAPSTPPPPASESMFKLTKPGGQTVNFETQSSLEDDEIRRAMQAKFGVPSVGGPSKESVSTSSSRPSLSASQDSLPKSDSIVSTAPTAHKGPAPSLQPWLTGLSDPSKAPPTTVSKPMVPPPPQEAEPKSTSRQEAEPKLTPYQEADPKSAPRQEVEPKLTPNQEAEPKSTPRQEAEPKPTPIQEARAKPVVSERFPRNVDPRAPSLPMKTKSFQFYPTKHKAPDKPMANTSSTVPQQPKSAPTITPALVPTQSTSQPSVTFTPTAPGAQQATDSRSRALDLVSTSLVSDNGGFMDQFLEFTLGDVLLDAVHQLEDERSRKKAGEIRWFMLARKYGSKWHRIWWNRVLRKAKFSPQNCDLSLTELSKDAKSTLANLEKFVPLKQRMKRKSDSDQRTESSYLKKRRHESDDNLIASTMLPPPVKTSKRKSLPGNLESPPKRQKYGEQIQNGRRRKESRSKIVGNKGSRVFSKDGNIYCYGDPSTLSDRDVRALANLGPKVKGDSTQTDYFLLKSYGIDPDTPIYPRTSKKRWLEELESGSESSAAKRRKPSPTESETYSALKRDLMISASDPVSRSSTNLAPIMSNSDATSRSSANLAPMISASGPASRSSTSVMAFDSSPPPSDPAPNFDVDTHDGLMAQARYLRQVMAESVAFYREVAAQMSLTDTKNYSPKSTPPRSSPLRETEKERRLREFRFTSSKTELRLKNSKLYDFGEPKRMANLKGVTLPAKETVTQNATQTATRGAKNTATNTAANATASTATSAAATNTATNTTNTPPQGSSVEDAIEL